MRVRNDLNATRRTVRYWCLYDWANSAFATVMLTAVLPTYFLHVAPERVRALGLEWPAESLWAYTVGASVGITALLMPVLGAIADQVGRRFAYLVAFAALGVLATVATGAVPPTAWWGLLGAFIVGNVGFEGSLVFYNALLPHVVGPKDYDRVSSWGFAAGYVGGGLALAGVLAWLWVAPTRWDIPAVQAVRHGLVATGFWWGLFGAVACWGLRHVEPRASRSSSWGEAFRQGWTRLRQTFRALRPYRSAFRFLVAYLIYNDAVETTIALAAVFGQKALDIPQTRLILIILVVQFLAFPGALFWGWVTRRVATFHVLEILLALWAGFTASAFFIRTEAAFWGLAVGIAWVLGGIQALSRSYYARLFPSESSGEFFGFYAVTSKFAAILGPILVGAATQVFGHIRYGVPWLVLFYIVGWFLLRTIPPEDR